MKREYENECEICKKVFVAGDIHTKYCSKKCREHGKVISHGYSSCNYCGEKFDKMSSSQKYCSTNCRDKYYREKKLNAKYKLVCDVCDKEFYSKNKAKKYCCEECRKIGRNNSYGFEQCSKCGKIFSKNNSYHSYCSDSCYREDYVAETVKKTCEYCKKSFSTTNKRVKFCSLSCATNSRNKNSGYELCSGCGKKFKKIHSAHKYCSVPCREEHTKKKKFTKNCEYCKKEFETTHKKTRYCSARCSGKKKNKDGVGDKKCANCGKIFRQKHSKHKYCSNECKIEQSNPPTLSVKCKNCGKDFQRRAVDVRKSKLHFCTPECSQKWYVGKNSSTYKDEFTDEMRNKECQSCGKQYRIETMSQIKTSKYCSRSCQKVGQGDTMTSPHRVVVKILRENRIWHRVEHPMERYSLDCFLGKGKAIEVMGQYWHGDIRRFQKPINAIQRKADKRDKKKKDVALMNEITILYIWEDDIEKDYKMCEKLILEFVRRNGILSNYHSMNYSVQNNILRINGDILVPRFERK